jgi:hypothetical protein
LETPAALQAHAEELTLESGKLLTKMLKLTLSRDIPKTGNIDASPQEKGNIV